nr:MAG TPA: hypothetical protein [Caudoviricetes sp.]
MSATPLITLGDEFVQTQSAQQARRSRRSQRRAMEALIEQAIAKKARVQVTAAAAEALSASLPVVPTQGMATRMSDDADAVDATPPEKPLLVPAQPAASMRTPAAVPHDIQALGRLKAGQMNQTEPPTRSICCGSRPQARSSGTASRA